MRRSCLHPFGVYLPLLLLSATFAQADTFYVADFGNSSVGIVSDAGVVSTLASNVPGACGVACDVQGNVYSLDLNQGRVYKITKTGTVSVIATGLHGPEALAFNSKGDLFVANQDGTVARITRAGAVSTFASGLGPLYGLAIDAGDNVFVSNHDTGIISKITKAGQVSIFGDMSAGSLGTASTITIIGGVISPVSPNYGLGVLAFDAHGDLFAASQGASAIFKVDKSGHFSSFAEVNDPTDIAFDAHGDMYVSNSTRSLIYKITTAGVVSTFVSGLSRPFGLASSRPLYKLAPSPAAPDFNPDPTTPLPRGYMIAFSAPAVLLLIAVFVWLIMRKKEDPE